MTIKQFNNQPRTAILHYTAPPVIGGVEAVIQAHCEVFRHHHLPVTVIAGRGEASSLPRGADFERIEILDTLHPQVLEISVKLDQGQVPEGFESFTQEISEILAPILGKFDNLIVHNIFSKHFHIPLTAALFRLLDQGIICHCIAWGHDFTWTSPNSCTKVHPGYPWDLLRKYDSRITYVTVSQERRKALAELLGQPQSMIRLVYNGVDPITLLGISKEGEKIIRKLGLLNSELNLLMPVRVTQAKNIEYALKLLAALKAHGIRPKLIHTGPPDPHDPKSMAYFASLQDLRHQLGLDDEVHFIFESGPDRDQPYTIGPEVVGDLYRISDLMLMPSHREGFGMPVLEAGMAGIPAICTPQVPAAVEIGGSEVTLFNSTEDPDRLASQLMSWIQNNTEYLFRRRVRLNYTWEAIFNQEILPLLKPAPKQL